MQENIQLSFDFDNIEAEKKVGSGKYDKRISNVYAFPNCSSKLSIFEKTNVMLRQICKKLGEHETTNKSLIFSLFYMDGLTREEIMNEINQRGDLPPVSCLETVRQSLSNMTKQLLSGKPVKALWGVHLKGNFKDEIEEYKRNKQNVFCDSKVYDVKPSYWKGISYILDMSEIGRDSVLFMLKSPYLIDTAISKDAFKSHVLSIYYCLQNSVRPVDLDYIVNNARINKSTKGIDHIDPEIAKVVLQNNELFDTLADENGNTTYQLRYEYLNNTGRVARIVYEKKNITLKEITEIVMSGDDAPKCISMSTVRKHYSWCVPLGKSAWMYSEDGSTLERIQDVVERYCHEHVRFTMDQIKEDLAPYNYLNNDNSFRCYILKHCRSHNTIPNYFCLTEAVKEDEEHLWMSKHHVTTRNKYREYRIKVEKKIARKLRTMPDRIMPMKDIRHEFGYIMEKNGVNVSNLYKIIETSPRLVTVNVDGVKMVRLEE